MRPHRFDFSLHENDTGFYTCSHCGNELFAASKKFDAGCGFPSFWMHLGGNVKLQPLHTYGRSRIQLLCAACGSHLGHLFANRHTPSGVRYCINKKAISDPNMRP